MFDSHPQTYMTAKVTKPSSLKHVMSVTIPQMHEAVDPYLGPCEYATEAIAIPPPSAAAIHNTEGAICKNLQQFKLLTNKIQLSC